MVARMIHIGFNARLFANNWRSPLSEVAFAQAHGFGAMQFRADDDIPLAERLREDAAVVGRALRHARLVAVMELVVHVDMFGRSPGGRSPAELLALNLPAIEALGCQFAHWHFVADGEHALETMANQALEDRLIAECGSAISIAQRHGFHAGLEHNEPALGLFGSPEACARALRDVPDLSFVWDFNHTILAHVAAFQAFAPRMSHVHVSDTLLPEVNYHLPLGMGNVDLAAYCLALKDAGFDGPAILEIGGLPKSGGYGRDTDEALIDSRHRLADACE